MDKRTQEEVGESRLNTSNEVEFRWLDAKIQGNDTVLFRLEDGALVKVKVDIGRAGLALNFKNPDGSPHYNISANLRLSVVLSDKKFKLPKSSLQVQTQTPSKPTPAGQLA
jgi:hypothetical protein